MEKIKTDDLQKRFVIIATHLKQQLQRRSCVCEVSAGMCSTAHAYLGAFLLQAGDDRMVNIFLLLTEKFITHRVEGVRTEFLLACQRLCDVTAAVTVR